MSTSPSLATLMFAGSMPVDEAVGIGSGAAGALTALHGELSPEAILVGTDGVTIVPPGAFERPQYGPYSPRERLLGGPPTIAGDIYSLGAILFHALAGHSAFLGETSASIMMAACMDAPRPLPPHVPRGLSTVILRCLSRDPAERYESPAVLREAIARVQLRDAWPGRRVLAADDDAEVRALYQLAASKVGVEIDLVAGGREAINAMKLHKYDVVLMDLNMPNLSGWEVIDFLRARHQSRPRRLFIITGFQDQDISEAERGLVMAALYKPVALDDLRALMTAALGDAPLDLPAILKNTHHRVFPEA